MNNNPSENDSLPVEYDGPSKSQRKRDMQDLQALGKELVNMPKEPFTKIDLPEELHDAIVEARGIRSHGALKRQLQYIGKRLRAVDPEQIRAQIDTVNGQSKQAVATLHHAERWRDRLLEDGDTALEQLIAEFSGADRQYLRQAIRNAKKEAQRDKPPKSARALFQYLKGLMEKNEE